MKSGLAASAALCAVFTCWSLRPALGDRLILGVPDWNQPSDYGIAGYPDWCAPTAAANLVGYWEDRLGLRGAADGQIAPNSPAYPDNPQTWMQGLYHDGTIELGWFMNTGDWLGHNGPFPPHSGGTMYEPVDSVGYGVISYAREAWTDPGASEKVAFENASFSSDRVLGQAMWADYTAEIHAGRPVLCAFATWVGAAEGTTNVHGQTVHLYAFADGGPHAVCGVGYIDPTPGQFSGDERIIAQDNKAETPRYVAVPLGRQWRLNDYVNLSGVTNYSGDPPRFAEAIAGRPTIEIAFDELAPGEIIDDQYAPAARFVTREGYAIVADAQARGTDARSRPLCAVVPSDDPQQVGLLQIQLGRPVLGASFWALQPDGSPEAIEVAVFDPADGLLGAYHVAPQGAYTHVAVLGDVAQIARIRVTSTGPGDGIGIDDVSLVTAVPEPGSAALVSLGAAGLLALAWRRRRAT